MMNLQRHSQGEFEPPIFDVSQGGSSNRDEFTGAMISFPMEYTGTVRDGRHMEIDICDEMNTH